MICYGGNWAPVVRRVDNAIHWISHHPLDNSIGFASVYSPDNDLSGGYSVIHLLNNRGLEVTFCYMYVPFRPRSIISISFKVSEKESTVALAKGMCMWT